MDRLRLPRALRKLAFALVLLPAGQASGSLLQQVDTTATTTPATPASAAPEASTPPQAPHPPAAVSRVDSLRAVTQQQQRMASSIQALLDGSLPESFVVQTLFEVDLLDEAAVQRRRDDLRQTMSRRRDRVANADSLLAVHLRVANTTDSLRLAFLLRTPEERARVNQAETQRRQLAREQESAARERASAEARAVEAEAQRATALADAQRTQTALLEDLAQEMLRAQTLRATLARQEVELAQSRERQAAIAKGSLQEIWDLDARLRAVESSAEAEQIFATAVQKQRLAHERLRRVLTEWRQASAIPAASPNTRLMALRDSTVADRIVAIRDLYTEIDSTIHRLREAEREARWQALDFGWQSTRNLNDLRIRALAKMSANARTTILGAGRAGWAQLRLESSYFELAARAHLAARLRNFHRVGAALQDVFKLGSAFYVLVRVALVVALAMFVRRRWKGFLSAVQRVLMRNARDYRDARRARSIVSMLRAAAPWTLFLIGLRILRGALGPAAHWSEVVLLLPLAAWYGAYRLTVSVLYTSVVRIATYYFPDLGSVTTLALLKSMRRILGVGFLLAAFLDVSQMLAGSGYLYHLVERLAGFVVFVTILAVLHDWRDEIADAYLRVAPTGRLSASVERTRKRWYGFFVGVVAFVWLAGRVLVVVGRDFALGFDQVRRALAFLFRRRMEKRAEERGYATVSIEKLPPLLVQNFADEPVTEKALMVDHFPGLDDFEADLATWREQGTGGQYLLIGERGMGKTSWLQQVKGIEGLRVDHCVLDDRVWTTPALVRELKRRLFPDEDIPHRLSALRQALDSGEPRLVVLDMCQNLFLGAVGGYEALEAFSELTNDTSSNVFWLCSCNSHAWRHLEAVRPDLALFQYRVVLSSWSEESIAELIQKRVAASEVEVDFQELVPDRFDAGATENRLVGAEEAYMRLLWDFTNGNPRAAMYFWLRSLEPVKDNRVRVRLFRSPPMEVLEATNQVAQFILAAVVLHENLTIGEAAAATGYPASACRVHLNRFYLNDILIIEHGRYRVGTYWHRTLVRFLRRKNLLAD